MTENLAYQLRRGRKLTACVAVKVRYADFAHPIPPSAHSLFLVPSRPHSQGQVPLRSAVQPPRAGPPHRRALRRTGSKVGSKWTCSTTWTNASNSTVLSIAFGPSTSISSVVTGWPDGAHHRTLPTLQWRCASVSCQPSSVNSLHHVRPLRYRLYRSNHRKPLPQTAPDVFAQCPNANVSHGEAAPVIASDSPRIAADAAVWLHPAVGQKAVLHDQRPLRGRPQQRGPA